MPVKGIQYQKFTKWMFEKRDIDGLVVALLISSSLSKVVNSFVDGLVEPIMNAFIEIDQEHTHDVYITNKLSKFKLNLFINNCIKFFVNCFIAYALFKIIK